MWTKEDDRRVIDDVFGGDVQQYAAELHEGRRKTLKWDDILAASTILPELELTAQELIKELLGYLPPVTLTLQQEPFIRALLHHYRSGGLSFDELVVQAEQHIKSIRNAELSDNSCLTYERELYRKYFDYLPELASKVKDRLTGFLGYEPALEHSLVAEIHLRDALLHDKFFFPETLTRTDIQAITLIKYREVMLANGKEAADASPLIAMDLIAGQRLTKQNSNT